MLCTKYGYMSIVHITPIYIIEINFDKFSKLEAFLKLFPNSFPISLKYLYDLYSSKYFWINIATFLRFLSSSTSKFNPFKI